MSIETHKIKLKTMNSPTILVRVIQVIKRKRIPIRCFSAGVMKLDDEEGNIKITIQTDENGLRLVKSQLEKLIDVIEVQ